MSLMMNTVQKTIELADFVSEAHFSQTLRSSIVLFRCVRHFRRIDFRNHERAGPYLHRLTLEACCEAAIERYGRILLLLARPEEDTDD